MIEENNSIIEITIHEGHNKQVRKMFESLGHEVIKLKREKVAFFDLNEYDEGYNAVVVTKKEYRGKGYALKAIKNGLRWYDKNRSKLNKPIVWWAEKNNISSQKLAEKAGFKRDFSIDKSKDEWIKNNWIKYIYK